MTYRGPFLLRSLSFAGSVMLVAVMALRATGFAPSSVHAQETALQWSEAERIWGYEDEADTPFMVADKNRTVHAMNSRTLEPSKIDVTYRQWTADYGWTEPVDVLLSPKKDIARLRGIVLNDQGYLNVAFYGGDEQDASIYYSYAPVGEAARATAWAPPREIAPFAGPINDAAMIGDGKEQLFVVYTGSADGMGVYSTQSLDGGVTWSEPIQVHASTPGQWPTHYGLHLDRDGRLHVAWSEADETGNGQLLYYTRLDNPNSTWIEPVVLESYGAYEVDMPLITEHDGQLLLVYHSGFPTTRSLRVSDDSGNTWGSPQRLFEQVGSDGPVALVNDSAERFHMFFGGRIGNPEIQGMWHSSYEKGRFTKPSAVVSGPLVNDTVSDNAFGPQFAMAVAVQGNTLLVTWRQDPGMKGNGVWYSVAQVDAPELPVVPLPTTEVSSIVQTTTAEPTAVPATPTPSLPVVSPTLPTASRPMPSVGGPLLLAALSTSALVGIVLLMHVGRRAR